MPEPPDRRPVPACGVRHMYYLYLRQQDLRVRWDGPSQRPPRVASSGNAGQRTTPDIGIEGRLDWADFQPAMVFKIPNAVIEGSIDSINMSMAKINVPEEGTSPAQEPVESNALSLAEPQVPQNATRET
eukprot:6940214-Prymnesium_polylepis.1